MYQTNSLSVTLETIYALDERSGNEIDTAIIKSS